LLLVCGTAFADRKANVVLEDGTYMSYSMYRKMLNNNSIFVEEQIFFVFQWEVHKETADL
jgi:hypothetical protein